MPNFNMAYTYSIGKYEKMSGNSYALSASTAYINTVLQIPDSISPPSFSECVRIAM